MPLIENYPCRESFQTGIRWHEPSQKFIAEIGYHEVIETAADGTQTTKRVRTVHYLGTDTERSKYLPLFRPTHDW